MTDKHTQCFFGQKTGLTIGSPSKKEPYIFIKCIKEKPDGIWEKSSQGEGKMLFWSNNYFFTKVLIKFN